jgi:argininosuccinate lyase
MHDDVHMNHEARLIDSIGADHGGRMHTTRSRNDQVVLDSKLFARKEVLELRKKMIPIVQVCSFVFQDLFISTISPFIIFTV